MRRDLRTKLNAVDKIPAIVEAAIMTAETDEEMVDAIGAIKSAERRYKGYVSAAVAETAPVAVKGGSTMKGEDHSVEVSRTATRSYNTPRLLRLFQDSGFTILDLFTMGIVDLTWKWTPLKMFAKRQGIELTIVKHEVSTMGDKEDGDVGENWKDGTPKYT